MPEVNPADVENIHAQVLVAFGQGASTTLPTGEACNALRQHFAPLLRRGAERWTDLQLLVVEQSRQLGRIAEGLSTAAGCTAIEAEHVRAAIKKMHPSKERFALALCPIC